MLKIINLRKEEKKDKDLQVMKTMVGLPSTIKEIFLMNLDWVHLSLLNQYSQTLSMFKMTKMNI